VIDIVCRCSHLASEHKLVEELKATLPPVFVEGTEGQGICWSGWKYDSISQKLVRRGCECNLYISDNLTHIEALAKERNLV
jgi:hypothetical protein